MWEVTLLALADLPIGQKLVAKQQFSEWLVLSWEFSMSCWAIFSGRDCSVGGDSSYVHVCRDGSLAPPELRCAADLEILD